MTYVASLPRACVIALAAVTTLLPQGARAQSQAYPSQDVNFIWGFAAGSGADITCATSPTRCARS